VKQLQELFTTTHKIYQAVSSPDIDIDTFVLGISEHLQGLKKHIPRCNQAFDCLLNCSDMLKQNFGQYYKQYSISGSSTSVAEEYIWDLYKQHTKVNPKLALQFAKIIKFYKEHSSKHHAQDKFLKSMIEGVEGNLGKINKYGSSSKSKRDDAKSAADTKNDTDGRSDVAASEDGDIAFNPYDDGGERKNDRLRRKKKAQRQKAREKNGVAAEDSLSDIVRDAEAATDSESTPADSAPFESTPADSTPSQP
jgi:hypothetical protein